MHRTPLPPPVGQATSATFTSHSSKSRRTNEIHERATSRTALRNQDQGGGYPWTRIFRMRLFIAGYLALTVTLFIMAALGMASAESLPTWPFLLHFLLTGACVLHVCNED